MTFSDLKSILGIVDGQLGQNQLTISKGTVSNNIDEIIHYCYQDQPIQLNGLSLVAIDENNRLVKLQGQGNLLSVPNLEVEATFWVDDSEAFQMTVQYKVLGSMSGDNDWKFSNSFPDMPEIVDHSGPASYAMETGELNQTLVKPLDQYYFFNSSFVVASQAGSFGEKATPLSWGVNFIGQLRADGVLGVSQYLFNGDYNLDVYGTVRVPISTESSENLRQQHLNMLEKELYPWNISSQYEKGVPGILLQVQLDLNYAAVQDKLNFKADYFYLYSPIDSDWNITDTNPKFIPIQAYSGALELRDSLSMHMVSPMEIGAPLLQLEGVFDGFSLNNLADLAGMTDAGNNPLESLPQQIQDLGDTLGQLELLRAGIGINYQNQLAPSIETLYFGVGMPEFTWEVWTDKFEISNINAVFEFYYPFGSADQKESVISIFGDLEIDGVTFNVSASNQDDFTLYAEMEQGSQIPLGDILTKLAPDIPTPSDLTIDVFRLGISPGKFYHMAMAMADEEHPMTFQIGAKTLEVSDVSMSVTYQSGAGFTGNFGGTLELEDIAALEINYDIPGEVTIQSYIDQVSLKQIANTISGGELPVPDAFDLELVNNSILLQKSQDSFDFTLGTEVTDFGTLALQIQQINGQWGAAVGLNMTAGSLSDLPGLDALKAIEDIVSLNRLLLIISTLDAPSFQFPDLAQLQNPTLSSNSIPMPTGYTGVTAGLNVFAEWEIDTSQKELNLLKDLLGLDPTVQTTLVIGKNPSQESRMFIQTSTDLLGKYPMTTQFGYQLINGKSELFLAGQLKVAINGELVSFDIAMSLLTGGIFFGGSMLGTVSLGDLELSNLAIAFGFNWVGLPSLGIAATLNFEDFSSSIALLFDSTDPSKSLLAGAIQDSSVKDIANLFAKVVDLPAEVDSILSTIQITGIGEYMLPSSLAESLNDKHLEDIVEVFKDFASITLSSSVEEVLIVVNTENEQWSITDMRNNMRHYQLVQEESGIRMSISPQLYFAPAGGRIGALEFFPGYYLSGALSVLGLTWESQIEIQTNKGIAAYSSLSDKLVILNEKFFSLSNVAEDAGPNFSMATFSRPEQENELYRLPHFAFDGKLTFLGSSREALVSATASGFSFVIAENQQLTIPGNVFSGTYELDWEINGDFSFIQNFSAGGDTDLKLTGKLDIAKLLNVDVDDLGELSLNLVIATELDTGYNGSAAYLDLEGHFEFGNEEYGVTVNLDAENAEISDFADEVFDQIKTIFSRLLDTAEEWAAALEDGVVAAEKSAKKMAKVFKGVYNKSAKESAALLKSANHVAKDISDALKDKFSLGNQAALTLLRETGFGIDDITGVIDEYGINASSATQLLKDIGYGSTAIASSLKRIFEIDGQALANAFEGIYTAKTIATCLESTFGAGAKDITAYLQNAGFDASTIGDAIKSKLSVSAADAADYLKDAGFGASDIATSLADKFSQGPQSITNLLKNVGFGSVVITGALRWRLNVAAANATSYLKNAGFNSIDIASGLSSKFNRGAQNVASLLKNAGFGSGNVAEALNAALNVSAEDAADYMKNVGFSGAAIATELEEKFNESAKDITQHLESAGFGSRDIGEILHDTLDISAEDAADYLKSAGFSAKNVGETLKKDFGTWSENGAKFLKRAGFGANDIAKTLKSNDVWDKGVSATGKALKKAGFGKSTTKDALDAAGFGWSSILSVIDDIF